MKTWYSVYVDGNCEAGSNQLRSALIYAVQDAQFGKTYGEIH